MTGSRGMAGSMEADGSRHLLGALYSLSLSTGVAALIFQSASMGQFLLITLTLSMIFTATSLISMLAAGFFHPLDLAVCGHLPISGLARFSARLS